MFAPALPGPLLPFAAGLLPFAAGLLPCAAGGDPWFTDVTAAALPAAAFAAGEVGADWILEVNGPGVALVDLDRDGDVDLVLTRGSTARALEAGAPGPAPRVYLNHGDGTFAPGGAAWTVEDGRWTWPTGVAVGDVDGDGFEDLVVCQVGADRVLRNRAGAGLEALDDLPASEAWSTSAAFLDADRDGALDLYVVSYLVPEQGEDRRRSARWKGHAVMAGPEGLVPVHDRLYRGRGDGTFEDITVAAGLRPERAGYGLGVTTLDVDGDGWTDLYVSNDSTANFLWRARGDGTFEEAGFRLGVSHDGSGREQAGMGLAVDDGARLVFVTNFSGESNALYAPTRSGTSFRERAARRGLAGPSLARLGWGTGFGDVDLDGDLDLWVLNGHVYPAADAAGTDTSYAQPDQLFAREGDDFTERALDAGPPRVSRAGAQADLDGDGDLDLVAVGVDGAARVLRNDAPRPGGARWLCVRPGGARGAVLGHGAHVAVRAGDRTWERLLRSSAGYQASAPLEAHFGLGAVADDVPVSVVVTWPGGARSEHADVAPDRVLVVLAPDAAAEDER